MIKYDINYEPIMRRQLIEIIQFACTKVLSRREMLEGGIDLVKYNKTIIENILLNKLRDFIIIDEISEPQYGQTRYLAHIHMPYIVDEKIKKLNDNIYYLNDEVLKQKIEIKRLNNWIRKIKRPWYKKLYWRIK